MKKEKIDECFMRWNPFALSIAEEKILKEIEEKNEDEEDFTLNVLFNGNFLHDYLKFQVKDWKGLKEYLKKSKHFDEKKDYYVYLLRLQYEKQKHYIEIIKLFDREKNVDFIDYDLIFIFSKKVCEKRILEQV